MCLTRVEQRGRITFLNLLAVLLLIQLSTWKLPGHIADSCSVGGPSDPSLQSCFPASQPQPVHGVVPPKVQDMTFAFAELHKVPVKPFLQPLQLPLNGRPALQFGNHSYQANCVFVLIPGKKSQSETKPWEKNKANEKNPTTHLPHLCITWKDIAGRKVSVWEGYIQKLPHVPDASNPVPSPEDLSRPSIVSTSKQWEGMLK